MGLQANAPALLRSTASYRAFSRSRCTPHKGGEHDTDLCTSKQTPQHQGLCGNELLGMADYHEDLDTPQFVQSRARMQNTCTHNINAKS